MLPSVYLSLDRQEKAFIIASIQIKIDHEKKEYQKMESKARR